MSKDTTGNAGSETGREVAEKVMGWRSMEDGWHIDDGSNDWPWAGYYLYEWSPSTHIGHAWEVLQSMRKYCYGFTLEAHYLESHAILYGCIFTRQDEGARQDSGNFSAEYCWENTAPLAICRAALAAVK